MQPQSSELIRHQRIQWVLVALTLAVLAAVALLMAYHERELTLEREGDRLLAQARVVDQNLSHQLKGVDAALTSVRDDMDFLRGEGLRQYGSRRLRALTEAMPGVRTMLVTDAHGNILAANRPNVVGMNAAQRSYFQVARARPSMETLYVSEPFETIFKVFSLNLVKIWTDERGEFAGIITATLDPAYFQVLLSSVVYAEDMRTTVVHGNGMAFISMPPGNAIAGIDLAVPNSVFSWHTQSGRDETLYTGRAHATGGQRMVAYRTTRTEALQMDRPLLVAVSRELDAVLAPWRQLAWLYGLVFLAVALSLTVSVALLQRKQRALLRMTLLREQESREHAEQVDLALAGADLGLWDLNLATGARTVNARAQAMVGLGPHDPIDGLEGWLGKVHPEDRAAVFEARGAKGLDTDAPFEADYRVQHRDGTWIWIHSRGKLTHRGPGGSPLRLTGTYLDITQRKAAEDQIAALAFHDPLTQLPNRRLLQDRLGQVQRTSARSGAMAALLFMDLDRFKWVNDTLGHDMGDHLLQQVAQRLKDCLRQSDTVARLGGDEFVLLVYPLGETPEQARAHALTVAHNVLAALREPMALGTLEHTITSSIGVALFQGTEESVEQVLKRADQAMYQAKAAGRNQAYIDEAQEGTAARAA